MRLMAGVSAFSATLCLAFMIANAQSTVTIDVPATARWVDTGLDVLIGDDIEVNAVGTWTDGSTTSGPDGSAANLAMTSFTPVAR